MTAALDEVSVRTAALLWLQKVTLGGTIPVTREQLANDFHIDGQRFPLVDRGRGIRKPAGWRAALSIMTAQGRPYADEEGPDGLHRYKLRRDQGGTAENEALRVAMRDRVPLIWFYGLEAGVFQAIFPVHLVGEEPALDQFVLALTPDQLTVAPNSPVEDTLRRYLIAETKRRLHQPVFASQVMLAYETRCAVCALHHRELLDAAHIIPDNHRAVCPSSQTGLRSARSTTRPTTRTSSASVPITSSRSTTDCSTNSTDQCFGTGFRSTTPNRSCSCRGDERTSRIETDSRSATPSSVRRSGHESG